MTVNTSIVIAEIASKTLIWLAGIVALVKLATPAAKRIAISGPKYPPQEPVQPSVPMAALDGQGKQEAARA